MALTTCREERARHIIALASLTFSLLQSNHDVSKAKLLFVRTRTKEEQEEESKKSSEQI